MKHKILFGIALACALIGTSRLTTLTQLVKGSPDSAKDSLSKPPESAKDDLSKGNSDAKESLSKQTSDAKESLSKGNSEGFGIL